MHGPPLTCSEIVALLTREMERLLDLGVVPERAAEEVARRHGIEPAIVLRLTSEAVSTPTSGAAA